MALATRQGFEVDVSSPAVSFIVPTYNLGHLLPECLASILAQSFEDYEILVMDDCSPDDTAAAVARFPDQRIRYIRNEPNLGHLRNYNKGIELARGRYVWLISADDRLRTPDALLRFVIALDSNPSAGYVFCPAMRLEEGRETRIAAPARHRPADTLFRGHDLLRELLDCNFIASPGVMVRRECYERRGAFPLDLPHAGDWYLWCLFALYWDVAYVSEPLVHYRVHPMSMCVQLTAHQTHVVVTDEIEVRWRIRDLAELSGAGAVAQCALAAIVQDYAARLSDAEERQAPTGLTAAQLRESVQRHAGSRSARVLGRVHAAAGDQSYWRGEHARARRAYANALREHGWMFDTWAKHALLKLGTAGLKMRSLRGSLLAQSSRAVEAPTTSNI